MTTIGQRWNWALRSLPRNLVATTLRDSQVTPLSEPRIQLLQMLFDVRWLDGDGGEPSRWWQDLSLGLLERGRAEEAFAVAAHITDPHALIALQADNRYKRIAASRFVERDILKAAEKELARREACAAQQPRELRHVEQAGEGFLQLHRYKDVLQLTDRVLQRKAAESGPYDDLPQQFPWILDVRAKALKALGRYDEALALLRQACDEPKDDPVGHCLNLSILLAQLNRPFEAEAALPSLATANSYGHGIGALVRVMVASETQDKSGLDAALEELQSHAADHPELLQRALIISGKDDEAAAELMTRLADPNLRSDALVELQDYADHPAPGQLLAWRRRQMDLRSRPEVHAAIAAYGRIRSYPIPGIAF